MPIDTPGPTRTCARSGRPRLLPSDFCVLHSRGDRRPRLAPEPGRPDLPTPAVRLVPDPGPGPAAAAPQAARGLPGPGRAGPGAPDAGHAELQRVAGENPRGGPPAGDHRP